LNFPTYEPNISEQSLPDMQQLGVFTNG